MHAYPSPSAVREAIWGMHRAECFCVHIFAVRQSLVYRAKQLEWINMLPSFMWLMCHMACREHNKDLFIIDSLSEAAQSKTEN